MLKAAAAKEEALLTTTYKEFAGHAMAIKGSAMWNLIYNPAENGAPLIPVSRDWNFAPSPANDDWTVRTSDDRSSSCRSCFSTSRRIMCSLTPHTTGHVATTIRGIKLREP